jgi:hypothetical protein
MEMVVSNVQWLRFDELTYEEAFERLRRALVPTAPEPRPEPRPRAVWWIALAYILVGTNFLASFGVCLADVSFDLGGSQACLSGLDVTPFGLGLINALLLITVACGVVLLLQPALAGPSFAAHWIFQVLVSGWAVFETRYGAGMAIALAASTPLAWYVVFRLGRLQKSGGSRPLDGARISGTEMSRQLVDTEVDREYRGDHDQCQKEGREVPR